MTDNNFSNRVLVIGIAFLVIVFIAAQVTAHVLMNGSTNVTIGSASPLLGQAAQTLVNKTNTPTTAGYTLRDIKYFDNRTWALATIAPPAKSNADPGMVIMEKVGQFYIPVVGPGTSIPSTLTQGLPTDLSQYLTTKGLVYNAS
jgi:hypothetical protein